MRRLKADVSYCGLISKNPLHPEWAVHHQAVRGYDLDELADPLTKLDMKPVLKIELEIGLGRNCEVFEQLRKAAYRKVIIIKSESLGFDHFQHWCRERAATFNSEFRTPLNFREVRSISRSVAKWVWNEFTPEEFSKIQSRRGKRSAKKRWAGHTSIAKECEKLGISKATYYRRKAKGRL